eukprot:1028068-Rhodomonas_salina.1
MSGTELPYLGVPGRRAGPRKHRGWPYRRTLPLSSYAIRLRYLPTRCPLSTYAPAMHCPRYQPTRSPLSAYYAMPRYRPTCVLCDAQ